MVLPDPQIVRDTFSELLTQNSESAVAYLHDLGTSSGYINSKAIAKNICWISKSPYGNLECTINVSKPEKDPRAIARAITAETAVSPNTSSTCSSQQIPQCELCWENEGFCGNAEHPPKPGLRIAAITLGSECWGLQYSPYAYFTEHCIALSKKHRPMKIDESCFVRLFDFVDTFPFYFIGSNADLPIVGGSVLTHDHFQGGRHTFPLMKAPIERNIHLKEFPEVQGGIVNWPASTLRFTSDNRTTLTQVAARILAVWHHYSDASRNIIAADEVQHNTLNPIVRKNDSTYIIDLVLRNNRTDDLHPWGIFHAHEAAHHIKKENIGLIEIMGLAILPPRLAKELPLVQHELFEAKLQGLSPEDVKVRLENQPSTTCHATWATDIYRHRSAELTDAGAQQLGDPALLHETQGNVLHPVIQQEVAQVFTSILETAGVFKRDERGSAGWDSFIDEFAWSKQ